jgi:NADPH-dependent 2,4-dienoyl-CoA reductase/sulfur reductase-like enzyme
MGASGLIAVGSGPAGLNAASAFRAHHPRVPVTILTADPAMPYAKPPLSKDFLCGRRSDVGLRGPDWFADRGLDLVRGITVEHLDVANREVVTRGGRRYPYWHCVLACGSRAVPLDVPGAELALSLRSLGDAVALRTRPS